MERIEGTSYYKFTVNLNPVFLSSVIPSPDILGPNVFLLLKVGLILIFLLK